MASAITVTITVEIADGARCVEESASPRRTSAAEDPLLAQARHIAARHGTLSASLLQRTLCIGYRRAERLLDRVRGG